MFFLSNVCLSRRFKLWPLPLSANLTASYHDNERVVHFSLYVTFPYSFCNKEDEVNSVQVSNKAKDLDKEKLLYILMRSL